jgi:F0F1-type ATP synthase delta subunit
MSRAAVSRMYADTLLTLADRTDEAEAWLAMVDEVCALYREVPSFRAFLETPRRTSFWTSARGACGPRSP